MRKKEYAFYIDPQGHHVTVFENYNQEFILIIVNFKAATPTTLKRVEFDNLPAAMRRFSEFLQSDILTDWN